MGEQRKRGGMVEFLGREQTMASLGRAEAYGSGRDVDSPSGLSRSRCMS